MAYLYSTQCWLGSVTHWRSVCQFICKLADQDGLIRVPSSWLGILAEVPRCLSTWPLYQKVWAFRVVVVTFQEP